MNGNEIIPTKYSSICRHGKNGNYYYTVELNGKEGACDENGNEIIPPKYDFIYRFVEEDHYYYKVELNGKKGACDENGNEIIPPIYNNVIYLEGKYLCRDREDQDFYELLPQPSEGQNRQPQYASNSNTSDYTSYQPNSYTSSYSGSSNQGYKPLSDPNLVDNSEKISKCEIAINNLENKKRYCTHCNGTQKTPWTCTACRGTGTVKWGSIPPQYFLCNWCGGTGKTYKYCMVCQGTNSSIGYLNNLLKTLKETHGMKKEVAEFYHKHKNWEAQMNRDFQKAINDIAEPYLNGTEKSSSYTRSSSKCSICNGTGVDPHPWHSGDATPRAGGYTHSSGGKCVYCGRYEWHQHKYCPKCNANKY